MRAMKFTAATMLAATITGSAIAGDTTTITFINFNDAESQLLGTGDERSLAMQPSKLSECMTTVRDRFEQAAREILDLQRNRRLKKQISPRKMQERQQQTPSSNPMLQKVQAKPVERTIQRQTSWWQLETPEKAQKQNIEIKDFDAPARVLSEDMDMIESESSDIDSIQ